MGHWGRHNVFESIVFEFQWLGGQIIAFIALFKLVQEIRELHLDFPTFSKVFVGRFSDLDLEHCFSGFVSKMIHVVPSLSSLDPFGIVKLIHKDTGASTFDKPFEKQLWS
jgi:hypothetical protein